MLPLVAKVRRIVRKMLKVVWVVIPPISIFMVDNLFRKQVAAKYLFHHQPMLANVTRFGRKRMVLRLYQHIAVILLASPIPKEILCAGGSSPAFGLHSKPSERAFDRWLRDAKLLSNASLGQISRINQPNQLLVVNRRTHPIYLGTRTTNHSRL